MMYDKTNIILIGSSGCGKTTVGKSLSGILGFSFIDTDAVIELEAGMPVSAIFEQFGENYFRELETKIIKAAACSYNSVIATGGGCVLRDCNMQSLSESGFIVYLKCTPDKIYQNIKDDTSRPLLQHPDKLQRIADMLDRRAPLYERYADVVVDVTDITAEQATRAIMDCLCM